MRRLWIGCLVLTGLLILGLGVHWGMDRVHRPAARQLELAAKSALEEDWEQARYQAQQARNIWWKYRNFTASVADHTPMDEIEGLYAELIVYGAEEDRAHFAAICLQLARLTKAMAESHSPNWWNLL